INSVHASGKVESTETAVISTRLMGFITKINVRPGDRVKKGQLLATISNSDILAKRAQAQAMVTESEAALNDAKKDYERYEQLYHQQSASEKEFENIALQYNSIKAKREAARQMQKEVEAMLVYSNLTAPFSGVVTQRNADEGSMANPGMPILVLEHVDSYQVNTFVSENDISKITAGAAAEIVIKSTGENIHGAVSEVSPSSGMNGGQYLVKVRIDQTDRKNLFAGMYAHVAIASSASKSSGEERLLVPGEALVKRDQLNGLYTVSDGNTALLRWVTVGNTYGDQVEVLSGLNEQEKFILTAEGKLYNGVPVSVNNANLSDIR
ncbi:MAG TPA: efflux RND transporter periplasmic adaptor subunit, partial [Chryseosolibacter sp.]